MDAYDFLWNMPFTGFVVISFLNYILHSLSTSSEYIMLHQNKWKMLVELHFVEVCVLFHIIF